MSEEIEIIDELAQIRRIFENVLDKTAWEDIFDDCKSHQRILIRINREERVLLVEEFNTGKKLYSTRREAIAIQGGLNLAFITATKIYQEWLDKVTQTPIEGE